MARIISSRKKYVPVKDLVVYPSKTALISCSGQLPSPN